jgi:hypothetical protein
MIEISKDADPNYLATVIECPELRDHPNADRLQLLTIFGGDVIVAKNLYTEGEKLVFFPVESCISHKFLSWGNLLDKAELNADGKTKGFFTTKGDTHSRVKAVKLRETPSQGFVFQAFRLAEYYGISESEFKVGESFDTVENDLLVKKYIRNEKNFGKPNVSKKRIPKWVESIIRVFPLPIRKKLYGGINYFYGKPDGIGSLIVDGQWRFHYRTENAGKNIFTLNPDDEIVVSSKLHGTSAIFGNILCRKPSNIFRYLGKKLGMQIEDVEHKFVYSSRSVLKNRGDGKYTEDVWGIIAPRIENLIPPNIIVYGEIVGWSSHNKCVQKDYDYGITRGECDLFVYRMVENTPDGPRELSWKEIEEFCKNTGLSIVPVYFKGKANDMYDIIVDEKWGDTFLGLLKEQYLDKTCELCTTGVVNEGIVIRNESKDSKTALKYKSPLFLIKESSSRDKGEEDMEEES